MPADLALSGLFFRSSRQRQVFWLAVWALGLVLGGLWLGQRAVESAREAFYTDARIAHRLLSQRAVQHEAVLATLGLMQPAAELRLPAVYPQILTVLRRLPGERWQHPADEALRAAEQTNLLRPGRPGLGPFDLASGRFWLLMPATAGANPSAAAYAIEISLPLMVPWVEWPLGDTPEASPVRVVLQYAGQSWLLSPGASGAGGWRFTFSKHLAADSHPFDLQAERRFGWGDLPWSALVLWALVWAAIVAGLAAWQRQRGARRRAEELLRLGQVSRLNALGEMAAGLAHELNQPLTAMLANTQAAGRLLDEAEPDLDTARGAMAQAVQQGKRAAEVVARLRRSIERPGGVRQPVELLAAVRNVVALLEPEVQRHGVAVAFEPAAAAVNVLADPVALQQIIHNLIDNALQALKGVAPSARKIDLRISENERRGVLSIRDSGPGVPAEMLGRLFEPFVTSRPGGLGLGLSLCDTLAGELGGSLRHEPAPAGQAGACFVLELPLAGAEGSHE